jgi:Ribbon-helix-helix protein, copG family
MASDADLDRLAERAELGFDLSTWRPRRGRPSLDATAEGHSPRVEVRVPAALRDRVRKRAAAEGRNLSDVLRELLEAYASGAPANSARHR